MVGLVVLCLIWGGLAAWIVGQRASGANNVVGTSEPLSLDGQQIYRALSDADATAASAFLSGGLEPLAARHRYQADIAQAAAHLESATAAAGHSPAARDLAKLSAGLPVYTGEVETARADNRLGLPLGAAYLREASALILLVAGVLLGYVLYRAQRWLFQRTQRRLNPGLVVASVAAVVSLLWLAIAFAVARGDLLEARNHGSAPVSALAQADIAALQARADESLTLIDAGGDDSFEADFKTVEHRLGPGPGTLLTDAVSTARGSPGADSASAAATTATAWCAAHRTVRALDDNGKHTQA